MKRPTDVTAAVKSQTNRARSVAAGVVSGAGACQPVFETPHFDESVSSRSRPSLPPIAFGQRVEGERGNVVSARQSKGRVRAYGWCRAQVHTRKRRRDEPVSMRLWAGGFDLHLPTRPRGDTRSASRNLGTGALSVKVTRCREHWFLRGFRAKVFLSGRNLYSCATSIQEYSPRGRLRARACRPRRCSSWNRGF